MNLIGIIRERIAYPVTVEKKTNASRTDDVTRTTCISPMKQYNDGERIYIGIFAGNWKQRLYNLRHSFSNLRFRDQTVRSKYFWYLKNQELIPQIKWKIDNSTENSFNSRCNLCIDEKISIINLNAPHHQTTAKYT